jgi:hypothetical protein
MAYCTNTEVKTYLGISGTTDDALLTVLIGAAQAVIERHTNRVFEASQDSTRYVNAIDNVERDIIWLEEDLASVTTVKTNADSASGGTAVTAYTTIPVNDPPYYGIRLKATSTLSWTYTNDPELGVTIAGKWAYSTTPPASVKQACVRLAAYMYRQKDAQVFDVTAQPAEGVMIVPQGIPRDVMIMLEPYVLRVGSYGNK